MTNSFSIWIVYYFLRRTFLYAIFILSYSYHVYTLFTSSELNDFYLDVVIAFYTCMVLGRNFSIAWNRSHFELFSSIKSKTLWLIYLCWSNQIPTPLNCWWIRWHYQIWFRFLQFSSGPWTNGNVGQKICASRHFE